MFLLNVIDKVSRPYKTKGKIKYLNRVYSILSSYTRDGNTDSDLNGTQPAFKLKVTVFWDVACNSVNKYQRFEETCCVPLHGRN
jgi:hypothetical protein